MSVARIGDRAAPAAVGVLLSLAFMAAPSWAEAPATICVPEAASSSVLSTNAKGECPSTKAGKTTVKYKTEALPGLAELEQLDKLLPHVSYVESGVGGKPTIQFSGVNVQIVNGEGKTESINGEGNLVLGYDENLVGYPQTGSHDLILGDEQTFTSYAGLVAGYQNAVSGPFASISGGTQNTASGYAASVGGGFGNTSSSITSAVSGGSGNHASGEEAAVSGGSSNTASGQSASVSGGQNNTASQADDSVSGGGSNTASGGGSSISGGGLNTASGEGTSIFGGFKDKAEGKFSAIFGRKEATATNTYEFIP
jgi:hypothetical protein